MAATQDGRTISISTPKGRDFLLLNKMSATEGLSQLFSVEVELVHEENSEGSVPTFVDPKDLLGKAVTIAINQRDETARTITGIVNRFSRGDRTTRWSYYYATIVPNVWVLTQSVQSRIFQHITVPDILKKIFQGFNVDYEIQGDFKKRNYCVQYRESDFDFASRLMEEEGIYYYFNHTGTTDKMIIANTPLSHRDCPSATRVPYFIEIGRKEDFVSRVTNLQVNYQLQTGKVTFWDHNFQLNTNKLNAEQPSRFDVGGNRNYEFYDYPGGYSRKYDGIDKGGGEQPAELNNVFPDKQTTVKNVMESLDAQYEIVNGSSNFCGMTAGHKFELVKHPVSSINGQYVLTSVTLQAEQSPDYVSDEIIAEPYMNYFTAIKHGSGAPPFRPLRKTPKPVVRGSQTAIVVGLSGEEISTDKYGRVKVQFHWDREGKNDLGSSCWLRVAQSWAGNRWGAMFIPRHGMEVIVDFLEGDPDQPIITGCVYNEASMPPYKLPDEKTKMTIKSNSTKGGGGFNEFRFEDKKGEEQVFIHAEKDEDIRVKNDAKEFIGNERHLIVKADQLEKVGGDKHLQVTGNQIEKIGGSKSLTVGMDIDEKTGKKYALESGMEIHLKSGMTMTLETGVNLTLKVGGNFININPAGIFIKGMMVMLNSGGAAGSGSGSKPDSPKPAKEAAKADPGEKIKSPTQPPPLQPKNYSQKSQALQNAAKVGSPFVK
jgi:type VI secretion system secreted protein VgrG